MRRILLVVAVLLFLGFSIPFLLELYSFGKGVQEDALRMKGFNPQWDSVIGPTDSAGKIILVKPQIRGNITVVDSSDYTPRFLHSLEQDLKNPDYSNLKVLLDSNRMIVEQFSEGESILASYPKELNKPYKFTARKENIAVALSVEKLNQVAIKYKLEIAEFGKGNYHKQGVAEIKGCIPIGMESEISPITGDLVFVDEYFDRTDSCFLSIRIGKDDEAPYLFARLLSNCNGDMIEISRDNFPILREK